MKMPSGLSLPKSIMDWINGASKTPKDPIFFDVDDLTYSKIKRGKINAILVKDGKFLREKTENDFAFRCGTKIEYRREICTRAFSMQWYLSSMVIDISNTNQTGRDNAVKNLGFETYYDLGISLNLAHCGPAWSGYIVDFKHL